MHETPTSAEEIAFWQSQKDQLDRDAQRLRWTLPIAFAVALATLLLRLPLLVPAGAAALGLTVAVMGKYMVFVRGQEYTQKLRELGAVPSKPGRPGEPNTY